MKLQFPELSLGDSHKAWMLLEAGRRYDHDWSDAVNAEWDASSHRYKVTAADDVRFGWPNMLKAESNAYQLFAEGLFFVNSFQECLIAIRYAEREYGASLRNLRKAAAAAWQGEVDFHAKNGLTKEEITAAVKFGSLKPQQYPFVPINIAYRSKITEQSLRNQLEVRSSFCCTISTSDVVPLRAGGNNSGVIATIDIPAGTELFVEPATLSVISGEDKERCSFCRRPTGESKVVPCGARFCNFACNSQAHHLFPRTGSCYRGRAARASRSAILPTELQDIALEIPDTTENNLLFRALSYAVAQSKERQTHPLETNFLNGICAAYGKDRNVQFSFRRDIEAPTVFLASLGINLFENLDFDTWVIQTISARLHTNGWEDYSGEDDLHWEGINPLYSLFNHSCDPNATRKKVNERAALRVTTKRPVMAGEELFINYLDDEDLWLPRDERAEKLSNWFPRCGCDRCAKEDRSWASRKRLRNDPLDESGAEHSLRLKTRRLNNSVGKVGVNGRRIEMVDLTKE